MKLLLLLPILLGCLPKTPVDKPAAAEPLIFDPLALQAWHLENTGQSAFSDGFALKGQDHKIKAAHQLGVTGKGIRIAVSDDAVEVDHPDLDQNQLIAEHRDYHLSKAPYLGSPAPQSSKHAHGTAVTGLLAAVKGNTVGSYGVSPDALFAGFNYLSVKNKTSAIILDQTQGDFDIFNYSYGIPGYIITDPYDPDLELSLKMGVDNDSNNGSNYVKAAGNSFQENPSTDNGLIFTVWGNANFEADQTIPYYLIVGAINSRGQRSSYSTPGANLWISGAGGEFGTDTPAMITTDLSGCSFGYAQSTLGATPFDRGLQELNKHCDFTHTMNGTSSAAPVISGIIALMLEANPNLSWRDVKHILAKTADRVDYTPDNNILLHPDPLSPTLPGHIYDEKWIKNAADNYFSNWYGFGRANALMASMMALTYDFPLGDYIEGTFIPSEAISSGLIPHDSAGLKNTILVSSTVSKIESVQLLLTLHHPYIGDLGIELTSPSGTTSKIFLINSMAYDWLLPIDPDEDLEDRPLQLLSNAFYEEEASGIWTIKVIDGYEEQGELRNWSIKINGHL